MMDYFNDGEGEKQAQFAAKRDRFFASAVGLLQKLGLTPTAVSILGVGFALIAAAIPGQYWGAVALFLVLYVLMDGLDGPLARATNTQSQGGSLVDIFADQIGVIIVAVAALYWAGASPALNIGFAFIYINVIYLMVICNLLKAKMPAILRVKYFYFVIYLASLYFSSAVPINIFAGVFLAYYLVYFFKLFGLVIKTVK
ncbi:MAG: CDP-alcohol phosphatidyltransferase family protein [Rhodobacteraceae bacterium]|nr:CDP-alcohol phosphatidyltransferase family protein [Paracoccaceae bacterium]